MGRSRVTHHSADEDPAQSRSKRKRTVQNVENTETLTTVLGMKDGKKALYHCNYCNKDISGKIRIKCVMCSDFDLCVECFSVGAEVHPHKSNHPYRVMELPNPIGFTVEVGLIGSGVTLEVSPEDAELSSDPDPVMAIPAISRYPNYMLWLLAKPQL